MKKITLALSILVLVPESGFAQLTDLVGRYSYSRVDEDVTNDAAIILSKDSTYEYMSITRASLSWGCYSKGIWRFRRGYIFLTSNKQWGILDVIEREGDSDSLKFVVETAEGAPLGLAKIIVEGDKPCTIALDTNGVGCCQSASVRSFTVAFLHTKASYAVQDPEAKTFYVTIELRDTDYAYFNWTRWRIEEDGLVDPFGRLLRKRVY